MTTDSYPKLFDLEDDVRGLVRRTDPETSMAAATKAKPKSEAHRDLALRVLRQHVAGLTDFELGSICGVQQASIGVRRGELVRKGLVEYAGFTRPSPSGSPARVWRVVS